MSEPTRSPYEPEPTVPLGGADGHPSYPVPAPPPSRPEPYAQPIAYPQPTSYPQAPSYGQPIPYQQSNPYVQPKPYTGPQPYQQPAPYATPNPYEQPAPVVYLQPVDPRQLAYQQGLYAAQKSRLAAGLLAIFLGTLGVHNFYLGRTGVAVTQLLITVLTLGFGGILTSVWALIEGILILTRSPSFATDRRGIPLRD